MAVALRAAGTGVNASNLATLTLGKPTATQTGDYLIAFLHCQASNATVDWTPPSGWTKIGPAFTASSSPQRVTSMFAKFAGSSEPSTYDFGSPDTVTRLLGVVHAYSGVDTTTPVAASSGYTATTTAATTLNVAAFAASSNLFTIEMTAAQYISPNSYSLSSYTGGLTLESSVYRASGATQNPPSEDTTVSRSSMRVWDGIAPAGGVPAHAITTSGPFAQRCAALISLNATITGTQPTTTPVVIGHTTAKSSGSTSPFTVDPAFNLVNGSVATDDWILAVFTSDGNMASTKQPTPPAGWTNIVPLQAPGTGSYTFGVWAHKRLAGDTTYSWTQSTTETNNIYHRLIFVRGADDISHWITGTIAKRAVTAETTTTTAQGVTTTSDHTLGLLLASERTTAVETDTQVTCNNFTKQWFENNVDHTLFVATKDMVSPGATGSVTVTYPNAQAQNGIALQLAIPGIAGYSAPTLLSQYGFNEGQGTTSADSSGNAHTLTASGTPWTAAGKNGPGTRASFSGTIGPNTSQSSWTVMLWINKRGNPVSYGNIISKNPTGFWIEINNSGQLEYWSEVTNSGLISLALQNNIWYHVAVTCEAGVGSKLYINGSLVNSSASTTAWNFGTDTWTVGSGPDEPFNGVIDELRVYSGALSAGDIATQMNTAIGTENGKLVKVSNGSTLTDARYKLANGAGGFVTTSTHKVVKPGYATVTQMLAQPFFYCAHRGGSRDYPEMSMYAYGQSALLGYPALELSLARTSDGVWFGLHDASLDRTSFNTGGGSGTTYIAANMTWAQVQSYNILGAMAPNNTGQANRPYMRWEEIIAMYYSSHVIFVDPKVAIAYRSELLNMMDALPNSTNKFIGKYYGVSGGVTETGGWNYDCHQRGYKTWGYFYDTDQANYATYAPRWDITGMNYTAAQSYWDALAAAAPGKPIMGHICPDAASVATSAVRGAKGVMVSGVKLNIPPAIQ